MTTRTFPELLIAYGNFVNFRFKVAQTKIAEEFNYPLKFIELGFTRVES